MERETAQRVWAAGAYAGLTPPKLAKELGVSVDTLKRTVRGEREPRAFESERFFLERVAEVCGLPYEFFTVDFARLGDVPDPESTWVSTSMAVEEALRGQDNETREAVREAFAALRRHLVTEQQRVLDTFRLVLGEEEAKAPVVGGGPGAREGVDPAAPPSDAEPGLLDAGPNVPETGQPQTPRPERRRKSASTD